MHKSSLEAMSEKPTTEQLASAARKAVGELVRRGIEDVLEEHRPNGRYGVEVVSELCQKSLNAQSLIDRIAQQSMMLITEQSIRKQALKEQS